MQLVKLLLLFILISFSTSSCQNNDSEKELWINKSFYDKFKDSTVRDSLANRISLGDSVAYQELREIYFLSTRQEEFLYFALIMANNFDYKEAYFDIHWILKERANQSGDSVLSKLSSYALKKSGKHDF